eukprot:TRINITY_DN9274_c0_g1_i1.p1 TRINITY_DN9274_c0_g1~~TRINITY_DN9274_c0_g1_i1.p1  ORF type:complete len:605 (-),score=61.82 TRINITY_DN9274_c0_g1_i1:47-1861(-)
MRSAHLLGLFVACACLLCLLFLLPTAEPLPSEPSAVDGRRGEPSRLQELMSWEPVLGRFAFDITSNSTYAKRLFRIGLLLLYNFDQPNAREAFEAALVADEACAMCAWGHAHSYGPFLNRPTKSVTDLRMGLSSALHASRLLAKDRLKHSPKEQVLIDAMVVRYPRDPQLEDQLASYKEYAARLHEMRKSSAVLSVDPDLMVFDAEARMVLMCDSAGYHFYESRGDSAPPVEMPGTKQASNLLRAALNITNQTHPYAQHLLIHSTEMSNSEALTVKDVAAQLFRNMKGLQDQHLQHMTTHTFLRTGAYHEGVEGGMAAVSSDAAYLHHGLLPYGPGHNSVFLVCSAMWGGERAVAYKYAQVMQQIFAKAPSRPDGPDGSRAWSYPMLVAVRFGDWDHVQRLDALPPSDFSEQWPYGYGVLRHFGLAVAESHLGRSRDSEAHLRALRTLMPNIAKSGDAVFTNLSRIANHTASAVAASDRGDATKAVNEMKAAVDIELSMKYDEPPAWILPSRECYGQALLNAGRPEDAEGVFRSALYGYSFHAEPRCGWAIFGLRESLRRQERTIARKKEIESLTDTLREVWKYSDVKLTSPCLLLSSPRTLQA